MKVKKSNEKVLLVAQEIAFAKALAANDKSLRERALRKLNKWLKSHSKPEESYSEETFMRLWKGLYYFVYMSDKPLVQESGIESISNLIHCFKNFEDTRKFIRCFFQSMSQAWFNLDGHRMDKYLMLVRRFLRQTFESLRKNDWDHTKVIQVSEDLTSALFMAPLGLNLHLTEIFLEELSKIGRGALKPSSVLELIKPFGELMHLSSDSRLLQYIKKYIFFYLLQQSEQGVKHEMKFQAWRERGYPGGRIDVLEEVEEDDVGGSDDEEAGDDAMDEPVLDPRAGKVDVFLPPIDFEPEPIVKYLASLKKNKDTTNPARKLISVITNSFNSYTRGKFPLGIHKINKIKEGDLETEIDKAVERLVRTEKELYEASQVDPPENTKKGKKKKKKSRLLSLDWVVSSLSDEPRLNGYEQNGDENNLGESESIKGSWEVTQEATETLETEPQSVTNDSVQSDPVSVRASASKRKKTAKNRAKKQKVEPDNEKKTEDVWGTPCWESPPKNGETPTSRPQASDFFYTPVDDDTANKVLNISKVTPGSSSKKVEFVLNRNTAQEVKEYRKSLKSRPSLPFDASKKPLQSALKVTPVSSPVDPFFRLRDNLSSLK